MENIRFTSSGTEAVMGAVRLARGVTGRSKVIKFVGCYHGHVDSLLIKAGSGAATFGVPDSAGVPADFAKHTLALPYNDTASVERVFKKLGRQIAAVVIEPVAGNMGVVPSDPGFLESLRHQTRRAGALLIFDEVMSGYRLGYGGAQHIYGIEPDLTTLGKVIGGGMPVGAFGGAAKWMRALSPVGPVYQAGTLSGHPVAMASGLAALKALSGDFYDKLTRRCEDFITRASGILARQGAVVSGKGTMFTVFFNAKRPRNFRDVLRSDQNKFRKFFHAMLDSGLYGPPSAFESSFISAAHGEKELSATLKVWERFRG